MDSIWKIILVAILNFCGLPLVGLGLGFWLARGMPGSPFVLHRREITHPNDDFDEDFD